MVTPLLRTKLYIPPLRPELISRPGLIAQLDAGLDRKLTLISAPAGFGKTTLLSEWEARSGRPVAWVSLDKDDNDPTRFCSYLIAALQTIRPNVGKAVLAALQSPQPPAIEALLTSLINEIIEVPDEREAVLHPTVLILDDHHLITAQPVHDALTFLLDNLPPQMHVILAGRTDPPWPLARLRARGEMNELRIRDLRFTHEEASAFLNDVMGLGLSAEEIAALDARTEGWIAGLQMAALSMQGRQDPGSFINAFSGSHRFILDYLVEEVLDRQPGHIQDFLLKTSILERLSAPLCEAIGFDPAETEKDWDDSQSILVELDRANLFLIPLDDQRRWYRYHHLFADLLRSRLEQVRPDLVVVLHRRASRWFEENGLITEAVSHALAIDDVERVAQLAEKNVLGMMDHGELGVLVRWLERLPDGVRRSRPWLCVAHAWALAHAGSFDAALSCLQDSEEILTRSSEPVPLSETDGELSIDEATHIRGHESAIRCYVENLSQGDMSKTIQLAQEALAQLPQHDQRARGLVAVLLGLGQRKIMDYAAAHKTLQEALVASREADQGYATVDLLCQKARVESDQGLLRQAAATCREAMQLAAKYGGPDRLRLPVVSYALTSLSGILYEWNELDDALYYVKESLALSQQWGQANSQIDGYQTLASIYAARGEFSSALEAIHHAQEVARPLSAGRPFLSELLEAFIRLAMDDITAAAQWAQDSGTEVHDDDQKRWYLARIHVAEYRQGLRRSLDDTLDVVTRAQEAYEKAGTMGSVIRALVFRAMALQALGEVDPALEALAEALSLAEPEGYVRTFINEGSPMGELLRQAIARGIAVAYAGKLLATLADETGPLRRAVEMAALVEPLSERELEVLRLLTTPLSSTEIARELYIAPSTVRSHIKSIYGKLGVHSRLEAVQRAKEMGFI